MAVLSQQAKRLTLMHGTDQCTILLVEGAEPSSLMSSIQARFQLSNNMFYLTEPDQSCLVPLTSALPDRLTLYVRSTDCATTSILDTKPDLSPAAKCFYIGDGMQSTFADRVRHQGLDSGQSHSVLTEKTASPITENSAPSRRQFTSADTFSLAAEDETTAEKGGGFKGPPPRRASSKLTSWSDKLDTLPEQVAELSAPLLLPDLGPPPQSSPLASPKAPKSIYKTLKQVFLHEALEAILDEDSPEDSPDPVLVCTSVVEPGAEPCSLMVSPDLGLRSRMTTMETEQSKDSQNNDAVEVMLDVVNRFERLNSDLANERTLLAWHRTCLAAMRTALAFVAVTALNMRWRDAAMTIAGAMSLVVIVSSTSGMIRYQRVKQILSMKDPPQKFGRPSNAWLNLLVLFASAATALAICIRAWDKE